MQNTQYCGRNFNYIYLLLCGCQNDNTPHVDKEQRKRQTTNVGNKLQETPTALINTISKLG
jgi:hypothetical protein